MADILRVVDRCERVVVLHESTWVDHICLQHAELLGNERCVQRAMRAPDVHTVDERKPNREVFYAKGVLPSPESGDYLKVVVEYRVADDGTEVGRIVTAYATSKVKSGEHLKWQRR